MGTKQTASLLASKLTGKPAVALLASGGTAVAIGGTAYIAGEDGSLYDAAGNLIQDINEIAGLGSARAGARTGRETFWAITEQFGHVLNNIFGGDSFLGLINTARAGQNDQPPMALVDGKLVETDVAKTEAPGTPDATTNPGELDLAQYDGMVIAADNTNGAPTIDTTKVEVTTDFGTKHVARGGARTITYADKFQEAAIDAGITLDENLSLDDAIKIAISADPLAAEEFAAITADPIAAAVFESKFDTAKSDGWGITQFNTNISGFFQAAHDGIADNTNAPLATMVRNVATLDLAS